MVAELEVTPYVWEAFLCERPPTKLLDAILRKRLELCEAPQRLSPEDVQRMIPITFPATHVFDPDTLPGCARFPVDDWIREGKPYMSLASWVILCKKICENDMQNLASVFSVCKEIVAAQASARKPSSLKMKGRIDEV